MHTTILGLGHHLPPLVDRGGVQRPMASDPVGPSTLAVKAAGDALAQARVAVDAVDFIIFATMTPDVTFPGAGCYFQDQMGCGTVGALDLRAQCAGFIFALHVADQFVRSGLYQRILVIGAEVHSSGLDYTERGIDVARLFGDGAGAVLVGPGKADGVRGTVIHTDGRRHREFWCEYPSSRQHPLRMTLEDFRQGRHFPKIDVDAVGRFGDATLPAVMRAALLGADVRPEQVDRYIVSHILPDVAEAAGRSMGASQARLNIPARRHGHLTAAALPVALSEEVTAGTLGSGAIVCLAAAGAGFVWGATVVTL